MLKAPDKRIVIIAQTFTFACGGILNTNPYLFVIPTMKTDHAYYMSKALEEARGAASEGEIPVGALVVCQGKIIARAHNETEKLNDVTAHAEMIATTMASSFLGGKYLNACTLYVTMEPCTMCAGALAWAQLGELVIGAPDPHRGYSRLTPSVLHPRTKVTTGVLAEECSEIVKRFFQSKRG